MERGSPPAQGVHSWISARRRIPLRRGRSVWEVMREKGLPEGFLNNLRGDPGRKYQLRGAVAYEPLLNHLDVSAEASPSPLSRLGFLGSPSWLSWLPWGLSSIPLPSSGPWEGVFWGFRLDLRAGWCWEGRRHQLELGQGNPFCQKAELMVPGHIHHSCSVSWANHCRSLCSGALQDHEQQFGVQKPPSGRNRNPPTLLFTDLLLRGDRHRDPSPEFPGDL